jgi:hypothetical protein
MVCYTESVILNYAVLRLVNNGGLY